ncbi:MAG: hypothetical protein AAB767_00860 [Patescibacteria group bacterium]
MSKPFDFTVDNTLGLYQGDSWLQAVREKYGDLPNGAQVIKCYTELVGPEVETMDQLEEKTGMTIDQVLAEARR